MISEKSGGVMGGKGSGLHWRWDAKSTVESRRKIDIRHWHKEGLLEPHQLFSRKWSRNGQLIAEIIVYTELHKLNFICRYRDSNGQWQQIDYPVYLSWTACRYGGERPWFLCPAKGCEQRVAILYSGNVYACRHCHQLAYTSQREADYYRSARKAEKIIKRLGWNDNGFSDFDEEKPKGMHWYTYEHLIDQLYRFENDSLNSAVMQFRK